MAPDAVTFTRFCLYLDLMLLFGLPAFALGNGVAERDTALRRWIAAAAVAGAALSLVALLQMVAGMAGVAIAALDRATVTMLVTGSSIGTAWCVRMAALATALAVSLVPGIRTRARLFVAGAAGAVALSSLACSGHGAMDEGAAGWLHLAADITHLLAAGAWLGALAGLAMLLAGDLGDDAARVRAARALAGFSSTGTVVVATLIVTGAVNVWALLLRSDAGLWPLDTYRVLLLLKLAAFAAMLLLAALNRYRLTPRLDAGQSGAPGALRRSIAAETGCAILILCIVAWMGRLSPLGG